MSDQMVTEGYRLGEHHKLDQLVMILKVDYKSSDLFYALYLSIATPVIFILLGFGLLFSLSFQLTATVYYSLVSVVSLLYFSLLAFSWLRDYKPLLLPVHKNMHVHVYTGGFVRVFNGRADVVRWNQVKRVQYKRSTAMGGDRNASVLKLWRSDGKKFVFNSALKNVDLLAQLSEREYQKYHLSTQPIST